MHDHNTRIAGAVVALALSLVPFSAAAAGAHHRAGGSGEAVGFCSSGTSQVSVADYSEFRSAPAQATVAWTYSCRSLRGGYSARPQHFSIADTDGSGGYVRYMTDGKGDRLAYFLCVDPHCAMPVGQAPGNLDAAVRSDGALSAGAGVSGALLLYVLIPPHQSVPVGDYSDTLTVDLEY